MAVDAITRAAEALARARRALDRCPDGSTREGALREAVLEAEVRLLRLQLTEAQAKATRKTGDAAALARALSRKQAALDAALQAARDAARPKPRRRRKPRVDLPLLDICGGAQS